MILLKFFAILLVLVVYNTIIVNITFLIIDSMRNRDEKYRAKYEELQSEYNRYITIKEIVTKQKQK